MEYFILTQDSRIDVPEAPYELREKVPRQLVSVEKDKIFRQTMAFPLTHTSGWYYGAIIARPVYLVNTGVKEVLSNYDSIILCTPVMFNDQDRGKQQLYWLLNVKRIDSLSTETTFYAPQDLKTLVLDEKKIRDKPVFKIKGIIEEYLVIRLDVAESLLRRDLYGIELKPVLTDQLTREKGNQQVNQQRSEENGRKKFY